MLNLIMKLSYTRSGQIWRTHLASIITFFTDMLRQNAITREVDLCFFMSACN